jgi:hypothetical protein
MVAEATGTFSKLVEDAAECRAIAHIKSRVPSSEASPL